MLKLTKKADYGLIAVKHLAVSGRSGAASAKEIADAYGIPLPILAKVLQKLGKSGLLLSLPGTNGGYRLARDPRSISALEVIRAIEGPVILTSCLPSPGHCEQSERCNVREPLRRIHQSILRVLSAITVLDLSEDDGAADADIPLLAL